VIWRRCRLRPNRGVEPEKNGPRRNREAVQVKGGNAHKGHAANAASLNLCCDAQMSSLAEDFFNRKVKKIVNNSLYSEAGGRIGD
jgi:hypothetical protein